MEIRLEHKPAFATAIIKLASGEQFAAENGSMVSMSSGIRVETSTRAIGGKGGLLKSVGHLLGGESFFNNVFTAEGGAGEVVIAPSLIGDVERFDLDNNAIIVQSRSWLGSGPGVELETSWGGMKSFFGGEGLFFLRLSGSGPVLFNAFGAIHLIDVNGKFVLDTGHIVAFEESLKFRVKKVGGLFATVFSGEGLVCEFEGNGRLWIQTRNPKEFGSYVGHKLPPREQ